MLGLPEHLLDLLGDDLHFSDGVWVAISGEGSVRIMDVYNLQRIKYIFYN